MVTVKICGITNLEDALALCEYGADAIGFIFYRNSPRFIEPHKAGEIIKELPPFVTAVGVFVNEDISAVNKIAREAGLNVVQLHGNESTEFCEKITGRVIKSFKVKKGEAKTLYHEMEKYNVYAYLLDTYKEELEGGTGVVFDWDIAMEAGKLGRIILAGGLTPENVADAIKKVRPYAVDVSSGVEERPGKKDLKKVREFIRKAKGAL